MSWTARTTLRPPAIRALASIIDAMALVWPSITNSSPLAASLAAASRATSSSDQSSVCGL
jgi:hypothetical protein